MPDTGLLPAILALFRLEIQGSAPETYLVPLLTDRRRRDAAPVADALDDPAFSTELVELARAGAVLPGQLGTFRFVATPVLACAGRQRTYDRPPSAAWPLQWPRVFDVSWSCPRRDSVTPSHRHNSSTFAGTSKNPRPFPGPAGS